MKSLGAQLWIEACDVAKELGDLRGFSPRFFRRANWNCTRNQGETRGIWVGVHHEKMGDFTDATVLMLKNHEKIEATLCC